MKLRKQLSLFLDNKPGILARIAGSLSRKKINNLAVSVTDAVGYCVLRLVVDKAAQAKAVLKRSGFRVFEQSVIAGEVTNQVGTLGRLASRMARRKVNIDFVYGSALPNQKGSFLVFGTNNNQKASGAVRR